MISRHHLPAELWWRAIGKLDSGQSQTEVARCLNASPSVVHRLWRQLQITDSASRRSSQGRPTATTSTNDRFLTLCARRNRIATPNLLRSSLTGVTGRLMSTSGVRRRLHEDGLFAKRLAICGPLMSCHRRDRLQWARQYVH